MRDITEQDVKVFTDAVTDYFGALGDEPASIRTFYLACGEAKDVVGDLTGIITLSGDYRGAVYFAAPRALIRSVLQLQKTLITTDEYLLDAVGEKAGALTMVVENSWMEDMPQGGARFKEANVMMSLDENKQEDEFTFTTITLEARVQVRFAIAGK